MSAHKSEARKSIRYITLSFHPLAAKGFGELTYISLSTEQLLVYCRSKHIPPTLYSCFMFQIKTLQITAAYLEK